MSVNSTHAYIFLAGLYIGGYTNTFSNLVITGLITYIIHPNLYTKEKLEVVKKIVYNKLSPWLDNNNTTTNTWKQSVSTDTLVKIPIPINIIK